MRIYYGLFLVWTVRIYSKVLASHEDITWRGHRQFSGIFEIILFNFIQLHSLEYSRIDCRP